LEQVRVRRTTLLLLAAEAYAFTVAVGFNLIVVRRLDPADYGLWTTILSLYNALMSLANLWLWWISRFVSYGETEAGRTALALNLLYTSIAVPVYIAASYAYSSTLGRSLAYFLLLVPMAYMDAVFYYVRALASVLRPSLLFSLRITFETLRIAAAAILVLKLHYGVYGAILSPVLALALTLLTWGAYAVAKLGIPLSPALDRRVLRRIRGGLAVPLMNTLAVQLQNADRAVASAVTGDTIVSAYLGFAMIPRNIILRAASAFTSPLYAKALRNPSYRDLMDVLLMHGIVTAPALALAAAMPDEIVRVLNPAYADARLLVVIASLNAFVFSVSSILTAFTLGATHADAQGVELARLRGTPLLRVPLAYMARSTASLTIYVTVLAHFAPFLEPAATATLLVAADTALLSAYIAYVLKTALTRVRTGDEAIVRGYVKDYAIVLLAAISMMLAIRALKAVYPVTSARFYQAAIETLRLAAPALMLYLSLLGLSPRVRELATLALRKAIKHQHNQAP
jgi:O-antigen/teichoic acid export membrane protein